MKVLLIEDDPDLCLMVKTVLALRGVECETVSDDLSQVFEVERWLDVDVAIVDILLAAPITGIDIIHWLKNFVPHVRRVSYSAVISMNPELRRLADAVVIKGDPNDLFDALGLPPGKYPPPAAGSGSASSSAMTVSTELHVVEGLRLGKHDPANDPHDLMLASYETKQLPPAPGAYSLITKVPRWPMYLNNAIGDCAIAAPAHHIECWSYNAGSGIDLTDHDVLWAYEAVSGYKPDDPNDPQTNDSDVGCNMNAVANYWRKQGIGGDKIAGYVALSISKLPTQVKQAAWLFGGVYLGLALPLSAQSQVGGTWSVTRGSSAAPGSWGGHAVNIVGYDKSYAYVITWGRVQRMTWGFLYKYCDEAFGVLSQDWIARASSKAPNGFDFATLQADLGQFSH